MTKRDAITGRHHGKLLLISLFTGADYKKIFVTKDLKKKRECKSSLTLPVFIHGLKKTIFLLLFFLVLCDRMDGKIVRPIYLIELELFERTTTNG